MSEKSLYLKSETDDAGQRLNIDCVPLVPESCHVFLRNEPVKNDIFGANLHHHYILWFCLRGRGCLLIDKIPYILSEGEAILLAPGQLHGRRPLNGEKVQWLLLRFTLNDEPQWLTLFRNRIFCFDGKIGELLKDFRTTCDRYRQDEDNDGIEREAAAAECLLKLALLLNCMRRLSRGRNFSSRGDDAYPPVIRMVCQQLVSASGQKLAEIAAMHRISPGHLRRLFKKVTGRRLSDARDEELLLRAENLLIHSDFNISEIAVQLGFGSIYAFSRFFKKHIGVSPLKFRNGDRNSKN